MPEREHIPNKERKEADPMNIIRKYEENSAEMTNLKLACYELEQLSPHGTRYVVENIFYDYGQNWMYSGIVAYRPDGRSWQALNPADYEKVITSGNVKETCEKIVRGKYWYDP